MLQNYHSAPASVNTNLSDLYSGDTKVLIQILWVDFEAVHVLGLSPGG